MVDRTEFFAGQRALRSIGPTHESSLPKRFGDRKACRPGGGERVDDEDVMNSPEVFVRRAGKITKLNPDQTANVKFGSGPGRPHKISLSDILYPHRAETSPPPGQPEKKRRRPGLWAMVWSGIVAIPVLLVSGAFHGVGQDLYGEYLRPLLGFTRPEPTKKVEQVVRVVRTVVRPPRRNRLFRRWREKAR